MTADRYAVLDGDNVVNIILWDSVDEYDNPDMDVEPVPEEVSIGWTRVNGQWIAPSPEPVEDHPAEDPLVTAAKESAMRELMDFGVSETNARIIVGLPA
jgi:hypothetical protein